MLCISGFHYAFCSFDLRLSLLFTLAKSDVEVVRAALFAQHLGVGAPPSDVFGRGFLVITLRGELPEGYVDIAAFSHVIYRL